jgi:hypothetical protein
VPPTGRSRCRCCTSTDSSIPSRPTSPFPCSSLK